jgi:hypothetical protein
MPARINASHILVLVGGVALLASLFLNWFEPRFTGEAGLSAWAAFELLDIVLASLAVVAIAATVPIPREGGTATMIAGRWLPWVGLAALLFVAVTLLNDPPGARDRGLEVGAWIGLAGAVALAVGGLLSWGRVSVVISTRPTEADREAQPTRPMRQDSTY